MSDPFDGSDDLDEMEPGRGHLDGTWSPDWLLLSGCSARAYQLYNLLLLRVNNRRRGRKVWPGLATLAVMMRLKTSESVSPYVKELKALGAIDVQTKGRMPKRNVYRINFVPPPTYDGPMCLEDWDSNPDNRAAARAILAREAASRAKTRGKDSANQQVSADPGKNPDQKRAARTLPPDPGKIPDQDPGKIPVHDPGFSGVESLGVTPGGSVTGRRTPSPSGDPTSSEADAPQTDQATSEQTKPDSPSEIENQEGYAADGYPLELSDWESQLVDELVAARPDWLPRAIRIAVGHPDVRQRTTNNPGLVRRAFLLAAADRARPREGYKGTWSPNRMAAAGCPFWERAMHVLDEEAAVVELNAGQSELSLFDEPVEAKPAGAPAQRGAPAPGWEPPPDEYRQARKRVRELAQASPPGSRK